MKPHLFTARQLNEGKLCRPHFQLLEGPKMKVAPLRRRGIEELYIDMVLAPRNSYKVRSHVSVF